MSVSAMSERQIQAHTTTVDLYKTLITLSTAVLTVTVTFLKDIAKNATGAERAVLYVAWLAFILSLLFSVGTLMTLAGNLEKRDQISIYADNTILMSILAVATFLVAMGLTAVFGFLTFA